MKIRPVGAEMLHADGQTDMTKLIVAFHNYANVPKHFAFCPNGGFFLGGGLFSMILIINRYYFPIQH
jgi:hypothetical protein